MKQLPHVAGVAPFTGGRGLKQPLSDAAPRPRVSPPSRGARIETAEPDAECVCQTVAPFTGGAD